MEKQMEKQFVFIAAHQLREPLATIKWALKSFLEGDLGPLAKEQENYLSKVYEANERMIELVNDLLNAARIEGGKFEYEFSAIDLVGFVNKIIKNYADTAKTKSLNLKFENISTDLPPVFADPEKLYIVFSNLLDNALKYTPSGGNIAVKISRDGNCAAVGISDTGVGIPIPEQKRIFSKFFRASNVTRIDTGGTGLGLFIAKNIIKRHGGDIRFISGASGTTFIFTIPFKKESVPINYAKLKKHG